ncbi:CopM family metallochaperone [Rhizobium lentis]|uniref:DUF305 domain-containing protein n=1 Tax=Rhizobium lentis TaxID=1138194 RepID=A0A9Q3QWU2_9HYPH|nr:DUF305 domain-containing protein [Rhizobium lentis]MBX4958440.1 DUF305 domain-containing protein [Rhizobium lentis]MBX4973746.1 DUF305 domain-containing protein [Rhizobium lentis]MBX4988446.1 DUF305 domain-containing protein [Rhizobium lentis]MBX5006895.1 DUF305 domain-containing protein [Rhizobium lentis]MBX5010581.1 DUF305 domain-containing protein [Rhizobium lentis]
MKTFTNLALSAMAALASLAILPSASSAQSTMAYPEKCKSQGMDMSKADMSMNGMPTGEMTDYQKASMNGMKDMHMNMMQGMMKKDADVSFVCGMIAHHMGAISMSEVELEYGDNDEAKQMAKKVIEAQKKEIEEMSKWVDKEAK